MVKKAYQIFYNFGKSLQHDNVSAYASSAAFFFFLSIAPIILVICALIPYTPITEEYLLSVAAKELPSSLSGFIKALIVQMYDKSVGIFPVAILIALWSAGKGMMGLQTGLNVVHGVVEDRNMIIIRLQASFYTLITLVAVFITFTLSVLSKNVAGVISRLFPPAGYIAGFFSHYRFIFGWIILTVIFTLVYTFIPNKKIKLLYQIPGAALAAVGWQVYSWGFSLYLSYFGGMSSYGSLSTIVVLMFWLYFSMYLLLIGANLNKYFKPVIKVLFNRQRDERTKT